MITQNISVKEGAYLYDSSIDPYQGDVFHESPIVLIGASFLLKNFSLFVPIILILLDLLTAVFVFYGAKGVTQKNVRTFR